MENEKEKYENWWYTCIHILAVVTISNLMIAITWILTDNIIFEICTYIFLAGGTILMFVTKVLYESLNEERRK